MQFLTFMAYASACVAVAVGVAPSITRSGRRWVGYVVLAASATVLVAALWFVARPIPSFIGGGAPSHDEASAPMPYRPTPPTIPPSTSVGVTTADPRTPTRAPATHGASEVPPTGSATPTAPADPSPAAPTTPPTTPPTQPPPTSQPPPTQPPTSQPPASQPPPTHDPGPVVQLVHGVVHGIQGVLGSVGHLI